MESESTIGQMADSEISRSAHNFTLDLGRTNKSEFTLSV